MPPIRTDKLNEIVRRTNESNSARLRALIEQRRRDLSLDGSPLMYHPYQPSVPDTPTPLRYEPQPHYGLYEYPASTGLVEGYPITVPGMVAASTVTRPEKAVEDLFSEEAMARRALKQRYAESNFDNKAKSHAGAIGAWQIMPITYKDYLGRGRGRAGDLNDPEYNRKVRDWVMGIIPGDLQDLYSENDAPRVKLAKIYGAYNWGAGNMRKYLRKQRDAGVDISNDTSWVEGLNPETKRYIKYLALDEDIPDSTYTNRAFEEAAAKRGYMKDGGPLNLLYGGGPYSVAPLGGDYLTYLQTIPEVSGGMIEPSVVTAPLPAKFNGSQEAARRYAEGYQKGAKPVSEAMNRTGKDIFNAVDTVVGFTPTPAGAITWLGHTGADLAEGEYGKVAKDAGLAAAMGLGLRAIGKGATFLKNYWDEIGNFGEDTFRAFTDRVPGRVSTNFTYSAPVARSAMEAAPTAAKAASAPYEIENLGGGYMLKSLMRGNPLEKQISKNGTVNVNNVKALVGKGSKVEQAVVDKVLASEEFAGKKSIDYNRFRKAVQDELITYDRTPDTRWQDYGMQRIGLSPYDSELESDYEYYKLFDKFIKEKGYTPVYNQAGLDSIVYETPDGKYIGEKELKDIFRNSFNAKAETFTFSSPRIPNGSGKHYNANTIGHSRTYTTADEPDILHVMESQSDWAQSKAPIIGSATSVSRGVNGNTDIVLDANGIYRRVAVGEGMPESEFFHAIGDDGLTHYSRFVTQSRNEFPLEQASYLADNYTSKQIQENLRYAAEKGHTKMRYPTRETAAKIEGYSKSRPGAFELEPELRAKYDDFMASRQQKVNDIIRESAPEGYIDDYLQRWGEIPDEAIEVMDEAQRADLQRRSKLSWDFEKSDAGAEMKRKINEVYRKYNERKWLDENVPETYLPEHETILRKYDAFPKQFKKLYKNADVRTVTDPKGNTWYEVDVPENYLQQEWAYEDGGKMFRTGGPAYPYGSLRSLANGIANTYLVDYINRGNVFGYPRGIKSWLKNYAMSPYNKIGRDLAKSSENDIARRALLSKYFGVTEGLDFDPSEYVEESPYKPSISTDEGKIYYRLKARGRDDRQAMFDAVAGTYKTGKGVDKDGRRYLSLYDIWDLAPFSGKTGNELLGNPVELYDRIYEDEDPFTYYRYFPEDKPQNDKSNSDIPNDVLVDIRNFWSSVTNQNASGGPIHIKPSHRGRLTELKERTGKTEAELYNDGNPAHKRMVVFARNSRKWHEDGGLLDKFSSVYGNDRARMLEAIRKIRQK